MNVKGRDVLAGAFVDGVKQLRGRPSDGQGGRSAISLLLDTVKCPHLEHVGSWWTPDHQAAHNECVKAMSTLYDIAYDEWMAIKKENDEMGWDFLTIAWMHCRPTPGKDDEEHVTG